MILSKKILIGRPGAGVLPFPDRGMASAGAADSLLHKKIEHTRGPKFKTAFPRSGILKKSQLLFFFVLGCVITLPAMADTFTFKANHMSGGRASGKEVTVLSGNAEVKSDNLLLTADRIELQGDNNQFIECFGNVQGRDEEKDILFITDRLRYDRNLKVARLEGDSTLEDRKNEIVAKGRFIEYDDQAELTIFQISVRLFKDTMVCRSEYAIYRRTEKLLDLSGFPVVYKDSDEFRADKIRVDLDTDDVTMEGSVSGSIKG